MAKISFKGNDAHTVGDLPQVGSKAPDFQLVRQDLSLVGLDHYAGKKKILNIFPSVDTPVCAMSVKKFHQDMASVSDCVVLNISADLPFAQKRFCGSEGVENAETLSTYRGNFAKDYGVEMKDTVLQGLCSRAVLVLNADNQVIHAEQVSDIAQEPNYDAAIKAVS